MSDLVRAFLVRALAVCVGAGALATAGAQESTTPRMRYFAADKTRINSPAIGPDHTLYVSATATNLSAGLVFAVNPSNGTDKWTGLKDKAFTTTEEIAESSGPALSPDGTTVYFGCEDGRLYALNAADGTKRWDFDTGHTTHIIVCSPAVASDGTIYIGATDTTPGSALDSVFWAVNPDGTRKWAVSSAGAIQCSPAIAADGTVYFAGGKTLYAVTPSGTVKWEFPLGDEIFASPAIGADGTIYVGSDAQDFVALTPDGREKWRRTLKAGAGSAIGPDDTIYVGTIESDGTGKLYALAPDGSNRSGWPLSFPALVLTIPAIRADGTIIFGCNDGTIRAVNPDGSAKWKFVGTDAINASPVIDSDGSIYIGSGKILYALPGTGSPLSEYAPWPMYNHDAAHRSMAPAPIGGATLVNLATRGLAGPGNPLIAGFVLDGSALQMLLVRGVGPSLRSYLSGALTNPTISLYLDRAVYLLNDDWWNGNDPAVIAGAGASAGAFPLAADSKDSALVAPFAGGFKYTEVIESADQNTGVALAELYDLDLSPGSSRLMNVSTRGYVGTGADVLIAGFVIGGPGSLRVLIRGVGPGLAGFGVPGVLQHPTIKVFNSQGVQIAENASWAATGRKGDLTGAASLVGAFQLDPASADCATILSLAPGAYTVQLSGVANETGVGLVEVYALPH